MAIIHADDFGITVGQSKRILACSTACGGKGALNSTSIFVNGPAFHECAELIRPYVENNSIYLGLHINLVEGASLVANQTPAQSFVHKTGKAPSILVDDQGNFCLSFAQLLAIDTKGGERRDQVKAEIEAEITAQVEAFLSEFPQLKDHMRIDSHQHFHMIPCVFNTLMMVLDDMGCRVDYFRIPAEPVAPFANPFVMARVPKVNIEKNALLNSLAAANKPIFEAWCNKHNSTSAQMSAAFYGLMFSGCMQEFVKPDVYGKAVLAAASEGKTVEILFHPGQVETIFDCFNTSQHEFVDFHTHLNRELEARALQEM